MGKKGGWFSAIKRVFVPHSKEKLVNFERIRVWVDPDAKDIPSDVNTVIATISSSNILGANDNTEEKNSKDKKKKGLGKRESNSFIPFFKEPSSIEKILGDAEREHKIIFRPPTPPQPLKISPSLPPRAASSRPQTPRVASPRAASPRTASPRNSISRDVSPGVVNRQKEVRPRPEPTLRYRHASATRIQAAYRGYVARRSFRALRGLVRLQGVMRGQNVIRQTASALKYMQLLVRVQSQIQSRRIQMLENQARSRNDKEVESAIGKWKQASEAGNEDWEDSLLTKEEIDARVQRKVDAAIKRERAMAYAYSHQLWKSTPKSALTDIRSGGFPWWWNWLERQLPSEVHVEGQAVKNFQFTPPRPHSEIKPSPSPQPSSQKKQPVFGFDSIGSATPLSAKSTVAIPSKQLAQTPPSNRFSQPNSSIKSKYSRMKGNGAESPFDVPLKDDDSLTSCPPFSVPSYMASTISAKAKVRAGSNPRERFPSTPGSESKRRISFPLTQGIGSFKWTKGSLFSGGKDSNSQRIIEKHRPLHSIGNVSVDSTVSLPAGVGRKPFNRFV